MKILNSILILIILFIAISGCCGCGSQIIDKKIVHSQIVENKFQGSVGGLRSYHDCVAVLQDYSQYRVYFANGYDYEEACQKLPMNKNLTLELTRYTDSEGRYDITHFEEE